MKLSPSLHSMFNGRIILLLQDKGISTVADFLRTDSNILRQISNIGKWISLQKKEKN